MIISKWRSGDGRAVPVYRTVQGPGDYVLTDYGAVHWGVNLGVGWKAAVNFAFRNWLAAAKEVLDRIHMLVCLILRHACLFLVFDYMLLQYANGLHT